MRRSVRIQPIDLTLEGTPRTDANTNSFCTDGLHDGIDYLPRKPCPALFISSPSVRTRVGRCLKELVDEVTACAMYLYPVESSTVHSIARCACVCGNVSLNLGLGQLPGCPCRASQCDRRRGDEWGRRILFLEYPYVGGAPQCPKLEKYVRSFGVDSVRDLYAS